MSIRPEGIIFQGHRCLIQHYDIGDTVTTVTGVFGEITHIWITENMFDRDSCVNYSLYNPKINSYSRVVSDDEIVGRL